MRCILQESQHLVLIAGIGHIHLSLLHVYLQVLQRCPENTRLRPSVVDMRPPSYAASDLLQVLVHSRSRCSSLSVFVRPFLRPSLPSPTRQASFNGTLFRTLTASEPWFTSCMKSLIASTQADLSALTGCDAYDAAPPDRCDGTLPLTVFFLPLDCSDLCVCHRGYFIPFVIGFRGLRGSCCGARLCYPLAFKGCGHMCLIENSCCPRFE